MIRFIAVVASLVTFTSPAFARTRCTIQRESKRDALVFEKAIYDGEINEQTTILIRRDGSIFRNFDLGNDMPRLVRRYGVHRAMEKLTGAIMVVLTPEENTFSISTNHFDFEQRASSLRADATTFGDPSRMLTLFDGVNRLGISCTDDF